MNDRDVVAGAFSYIEHWKWYTLPLHIHREKWMEECE
jgi:hypothetical protein